MSMLRKIRITAASACFVLITLLFLDFTRILPAFLGWLARVQFVPALLAANAGMVAALVVITLLFGRVYCSVICPLGVFQDMAAWASRKIQKKKRYAHAPARTGLRYALLALFVIAFVAGLAPLFALLEPYSAYGRIASNLFAPVYQGGNNALAYFAQRADSYAFYTVDVWIKSAVTFGVALASFGVIGYLAWRNGRTYCNAICPVGTVLGFLSRFALFRPVIDSSKCGGCRLCERNCKASCIDAQSHRIDYSRCVACMNCVAVCRPGAIRYSCVRNKTQPARPINR
ncbi:MAG: 4Fe-4S binding protein [Chthoniobacteraceae bacterium]|nr:4Fe-4S binding protein [Chthoniobacteraceae bacterium]